MHNDKKRLKKLNCNEEIRVTVLLMHLLALFCWCITEFKKWLKKDKTVNTQDKTGEPSWIR